MGYTLTGYRPTQLSLARNCRSPMPTASCYY